MSCPHNSQEKLPPRKPTSVKISYMKRFSLLVLLLTAATTLRAADSTWLGTNNAAWTNGVNWSPASVPADGNNIVIADSTGSGNSLNLADSRTIGSMLFGTTGSRTTTFQITNNTAANTLTFTNGFTANGNAGTLGTVEFFRVPVIIANDQTWTIGGSPASASTDAGIRLRERATGVQNAVTLNGTLTKSGPGQLSFVGNNVGNGNIVVNQGSVKLNAGGTTLLTMGGTGSITVNSNASLMISRNSGTFNFTKAVVLNAGSTIQFGGGNTTIYPFPVTLNGNTTLSAANATDNTTTTAILTGAWNGTAAITTANVNAANRVLFYVLSNNISGWTGSVNHNGNGVRIGFTAATPGNAAVAWSLGNAGAILETYGAPNVALGSLGGSAGTVRNSDPAALPSVITVGSFSLPNTTFGGVLANNTASLGLVKVGTNELTLTGNNTFSGGTVISNGAVYIQGATAALGSGDVAVRPGARFGGSGTATGNVTVENGGLVRLPGGIGAPALTTGSVTFGVANTDTTFTMVDVFSGGKLACGGTLTVNGTHIINLTGGVPPVGVYDVITYSGPIGGNGFAGFQLGSTQPGVVANLQDSGSAIQVNVTTTGQPGVWVGNQLSQWSLAGGLEWKGLISGTPQAYLDLYPVYFEDTATSFAVNITADTVTPAIVNVSNAIAYTFSGAGSIVGSAGLTKDGPGTLTIVNSNSYTGGTYMTNGTVQLGNGGTSGSIAANVMNNGTLIFNRSDNYGLNAITGTGSVEQRGTGIVTVGGANSYSGATIVASGTFSAGSVTALGDTNSPTVVSNTATLDLNAQNVGAEPIIARGTGIGGTGAIVNNGPGDQVNATRYVTLEGPTVFGGARRWDIRVPTPANDQSGGNDAFLHANGYSLTKVSSNVVGLISAGDTALGDIDIQAGTLTFSRSTYMGDSSKKVTVRPGATLQLHRTSEYVNNVLTKILSMTNATLAVEGNGLTNNQFAGSVTLSDSNVVNLPAATGLNLTGPVNGSGSLTVLGPGTLVVSGNATHSGGTTLNGAVLQVDGALGNNAQSLVVNSQTTIAGNGTINYAVTIPSGSVLSPGAHSSVSVPGTTLGGLTINNTLTLQAGCSNIFEINKDLGTNDTVRGLTSVTMAGTLILQNVGSTTYVPGDSFKLFNATTYSGGFSAIVPATPALGLIWLTNNLNVNGTLGVAVLPTPIPLFAYSASSLISSNVNVIFSSPVDASSAQNPANYTVAPYQVLSATLVSATNVMLELDAPITNTAFTVNVKSVQDLAFIPNVIATTNVPGVAIGFLEAFRLGNITNGSAFAYGTNRQVKVYSDGSDIFGTQDNGEFVYQYVTGDFDVSVRLESLLITDPAAKAGIMVRDLSDPTFPQFNDRHYMAAAFSPDPTRNNNFSQYREEQGATAIAPGAPRPAASYPANWLRLKRTGSIMQGYSGPNGLDWTPLTAVDSATNIAGAYPATVRLGLAVTAHNAAQTTEALFSNFGNATDRGPLSVALSGTDVTVSWGIGGLGSTLQATPSIVSPVTWTNVPGSSTTNLIIVPAASTQLFFRLATPVP